MSELPLDSLVRCFSGLTSNNEEYSHFLFAFFMTFMFLAPCHVLLSCLLLCLEGPSLRTVC